MEPKITERCATRVILMSCGSYNPPTHMHLRMFERARDHLHNLGTHMVIGGVISPVNDAYAKKDLANGVHRCKMLKLALTDSDWIRLSTWEIRQNTWTRTRKSLQHHQNLINSVVYGNGDANRNSIDNEDLEWIPENVRNNEIADQVPIQIKLLCGGDLLESFATPGLWAEEDIAEIVGQYGLVVITREGSNPYKFIYDSDILSKHLIVTEWIPNEVSSTRIRRALKRGESVKYLLQDAVIDYVYTNGIYEAHRPSIIKLELSSINSSIDYLEADEAKYQHNSAFLTSSPSDINMQETTSCNVYTITTMNDISDCVLKKNLQNNYSPTYSDDQSSQNSIVNMYTDRDKLLWSMVFDSINIGGESSSSLLQHHNRVFNSIDSPIELPSSARARNELLAFEDTAESELATLYDNTFSEEKEDALLSVAYEGRFDDLNESFVKDNTTFMENNSFDKFNTENGSATKDETDRESIGCDNSEESDFKTTRFETNFEIDGKYLKSLVNSKKSPKKIEDNESIKLIKEDSKLTVLKSKPEEEREPIEMNVEDESHEEIKLFDDITYIKRLRLIINNKPIEINKNQRQQIQGSLDSINLNEASVMNAAESMTKKSKSLESIKRNAHLLYKTNETSYCDPVLKIKADSTAPLAVASTLDHQADEFCSSCCFVKTDEHHCPTNCSSPEDEDSTECDICSSYNLQDANDALIREDDGVAQNLSESMEICEICGEPATIADEPSITNANPVNTINSRSIPLSLPKAKSTIEISRGSYKMSTLEDDHFEIDNCGLQDCKLRASLDMCNKPEPLYVNVTPKYHRFASEIDNIQPPKIKSDRHLISESNYYSCNCKSNQGLKYTECKDEAAVSKILLPNGNKRLYRKGSCPKKNVVEKTQDKRRYSSVENLQNKMFFKSDAEILSKSMDNKLVASADSIRSSRLTRCKSLRRSADNVGRFDSLGDNLDSLEENADTDDNGVMTDNNSRCASVNIRDSDTIKMILTKHGIKIISQKETVL